MPKRDNSLCSESKAPLAVYLHPKLLVMGSYGENQSLVPNGVQVLIDDFAFVDGFPVQLELHVGIARA